VSDLVVGRTARPRWHTLLRRTVLQRLVDEAGGMDVHVVSFEDEEGSA
jgi:K+-sensing histidine kinase KdpD